MLVLTRKAGEGIVIGGNITVTVLEVKGGAIRIGIDAPRDKKIYRFNLDGTLVSEISLGDEAGFPVSLAVSSGGFFYVLDRHQNSILSYSGNGRFLYRFLGLGKSPGKIYFARQIRFDPWGNLCVVDEGNGRVEIFSQ